MTQTTCTLSGSNIFSLPANSEITPRRSAPARGRNWQALESPHSLKSRRQTGVCPDNGGEWEGCGFIASGTEFPADYLSTSFSSTFQKSFPFETFRRVARQCSSQGKTKGVLPESENMSYHVVVKGPRHVL